MSRNLYWKGLQPVILKRLLLPLFALLVLGAGGCGSGDDSGTDITQQALPTGFTIDLECADEGVYPEDCILDDSRNPYRTINIVEFDPNNEDADNKFDLAEAIPEGPEYAKSRFYFWATALARRASGENQYYTALALHELWSAGINDSGDGSRNAQAQAKKAYRATLDYFFDDFTFFGPFGPNEDFIPFVIRSLVATRLVTPPPKNYVTLFPGIDPVLNAKVALGDWGYFYVPPGECDPDFPDDLDRCGIPAEIIRNNNLPIPPQLN